MSEPNVDLKGVRAFVVVAKKRSVTEAARDLGYTQPAVSRHLREFEHLVGGPLFDRDRAGMHLTHHGEALLPIATEVLSLSAQLINGKGRAHRLSSHAD